MAHRDTFEEDYEFEVRKTREGGYSVSLPHQCDNWEIVGAEDTTGKYQHDDGYPAHPFSKELAIKQMELFIVRANEALEKLKLI